MTAQERASWIFGSLTLIFLGVAYYIPSNNPAAKWILVLFSALLAGLFGYFMLGQIVGTAEVDVGRYGKMSIQGGGAIFLFVVVLLVGTQFPDAGGQAARKQPNTNKEKDQNEKSDQIKKRDEVKTFESASVGELISLLDSRFTIIVNDLEEKKKQSGENSPYSGINDADKLKNDLTKLHESIKDALVHGQFVKAHELVDDFQDKLGSFYSYPITLTAKHRYVNAPEPGQDRDYDKMIRAMDDARKTGRDKYPGEKINAYINDQITSFKTSK